MGLILRAIEPDDEDLGPFADRNELEEFIKTLSNPSAYWIEDTSKNKKISKSTHL